MIVIEPFTDTDVAAALRLSQEAGWPHRFEDWRLVVALSSGVVARAGEEVVGTGLLTRFGACGRLSMVLVAGRLRGQGIGRRLVQALLENAGDVPLALVATDAGRPLYRSLGFRDSGHIRQSQGVVTPPPPPERPVRPGTIADLERICAMDLAASGCDRAAMLTRIARQGRVLVADEGFAMLRCSGHGQSLGPIVAADEGTTRALIAAGAAAVGEGGFLRLDMPEEVALSVDPLPGRIGLETVGGGTVMTRGRGAVPTGGHMLRALASQALG
ncbi:GNAT family N-acetyltransferase [Salipiger abyssi]|uniref:GNAT family N-acetyltransferase n=1 Tax=Salipiger abyssi TaxID=1250539 RepID=UPI004059CBB5